MTLEESMVEKNKAETKKIEAETDRLRTLTELLRIEAQVEAAKLKEK